MQTENENENGNQPDNEASQPDGAPTDNGAGEGLNAATSETASEKPSTSEKIRPDSFCEDHCLRVERYGDRVRVIKKPGSNCGCRLDLSDTDLTTAKKLAPLFLAITDTGVKVDPPTAEPEATADQDKS